MSEVACEHGAANVTTALVVARAGVSRRTFYEIFTDTKDCFLAAFDDAIARATSHVLSAYNSSTGFRERNRSALAALLQFLDEEPTVGRVLVVESLGAGHEAIARRSRVLAQIVAAVDTGRFEKNANPEATPLTAEGVVGGLFAVIHTRLIDGSREPFIDLVNPLMGMIVLPYLGRTAANREASLPVTAGTATPAKRVVTADTNPWGGLPMRLTYRTVRVLQFIAAKPGSTNREIGLASEVSDQGQISKLLARLQRLELVQNQEPSPGKGKRNAWTLTSTGLELEQAMSANSNWQAQG